MNAGHPEFSRRVALDRIGTVPLADEIAADPTECAALARRFGLRGIARLEASFTLVRDAEAVLASGELHAEAIQSCIATGEDVTAAHSEPFTVRFCPSDALASGEEIELDAGDCDLMEHDGQAVDMGEAVAQSFALALNPFPRAPGAEQALRNAGVLLEGEVGPFAGLKALLEKP